MSLALNQTPFETRNDFLDKMFCPCGPPPKPQIILNEQEKNKKNES